MTRVLIAVDGTEHSERAARTALALFGDHAEYMVINVSGVEGQGWSGDQMLWGVAGPAIFPGAMGVAAMPLAHAPAGGSEPIDPVDEAEQLAGNVASAAEIPSATPIGDVGDPVPAILLAADSNDVDVIVVGASHTGWFARLIARPVADNVVRSADRPVLVVP